MLDLEQKWLIALALGLINKVVLFFIILRGVYHQMLLTLSHWLILFSRFARM
jgi:hypothetical protein